MTDTAPEREETVATAGGPLDYADAAFQRSRDRAMLRLTPAVVAQWPAAIRQAIAGLLGVEGAALLADPPADTFEQPLADLATLHEDDERAAGESLDAVLATLAVVEGPDRLLRAAYFDPRPRRARARSSSPNAAKSCPATPSVPLVARSRPESTAISELLPEPEGPSSASVWPCSTARSIPRRISTAPPREPKVRVSCRAAIAREDASKGLVTARGWHS